MTALMGAAHGGHLAIVHALLRRGADPANRDDHGVSALDYAIREDRHDIALALIGSACDEYGAPAEPRYHALFDHEGRGGVDTLIECFCWAQRKGYEDVARLLDGHERIALVRRCDPSPDPSMTPALRSPFPFPACAMHSRQSRPLSMRAGGRLSAPGQATVTSCKTARASAPGDRKRAKKRLRQQMSAQLRPPPQRWPKARRLQASRTRTKTRRRRLAWPSRPAFATARRLARRRLSRPAEAPTKRVAGRWRWRRPRWRRRRRRIGG